MPIKTVDRMEFPIGETRKNITKTSSYPLSPVESGSAFNNIGIGAAIEFTLPSAVPGLKYTFNKVEDYTFRVQATVGSRIQSGSYGGYLVNETSEIASITLEAVSSSQWVVTSEVGTWDTSVVTTTTSTCTTTTTTHPPFMGTVYGEVTGVSNYSGNIVTGDFTFNVRNLMTWGVVSTGGADSFDGDTAEYELTDVPVPSDPGDSNYYWLECLIEDTASPPAFPDYQTGSLIQFTSETIEKNFDMSSETTTTTTTTTTSSSTTVSTTTTTSPGDLNNFSFNPSDKSSDITLSNNNRTMSHTGSTNSQQAARSVGYKNGGKWYFEVHIDHQDDNAHTIGWMNSLHALITRVGEDGGQVGVGWHTTLGRIYHDGTYTAYAGSAAADDYVMVAADLDNGYFWFGVNGTWLSSGDPANGTNISYTETEAIGVNMYPAVGNYDENDHVATIRTKSTEFEGSIPSGFSALE